MSKMSEDTTATATTENIDDETTVVVDAASDEQRGHEELVANVAKLLEPPDYKDDKSEKSEPPAEAEEPTTAEDTAKDGAAKDGESELQQEGLSEDLQARAKGIGLSDDLTQRLHQSNQLEETLAAFDRRMIEYIQSKEKESDNEPVKDEVRREQVTQQPPSKSNDNDVPTLDPNVYDEDLVKRDAYQQQRIDSLQQELEGMRSQMQELIDAQYGGFDEWFDEILTDLGVDTNDNDKCQSVFKAYGAICDAFGKGVNDRDKSMVERAHAAMYPQDVFKQKQRQTVDRLRDAQGKFLSKSQSKGGPPPKDATDEEVHEHLVSKVTTYLKEQGVQMSGV